MFFSPSRAVLSAILRDEYLTSAVRTKEIDKAGSNQQPACDPVQFKKFLEKSDPEVARPAFSTLPVQKCQPKAFEVRASIQIHQSAYRDRWQFKTAGFKKFALNSAFWNTL